jgi:hypothetical protein
MQRGAKIRKNGDLRGLPEVRVIGPSGKMLGVMALAEGLRLAFKEGLDLVEVNPKGTPPVCAILDFGKYTDDVKKSRADGQRRVSQCGRFLIDGGRVGVVTFNDGADRGQLEWETPGSISAFDIVIFGESGWWSTPEARKMSQREVRDLANELAVAMRVRIELWLSGRSEVIRPPEEGA